MKLTKQLKNESGYSFVLSKLTPFSAFGKASIIEPFFYGKYQKDELEQEFCNISTTMVELDARNDKYYKIMHTLSRFRDMRGCLNRGFDTPMDQVELFEIKYFLLVLKEFIQIYDEINKFSNLEILDMSEMLKLLDPDEENIATFQIYNSYSEKLAKTRENKRKIELILQGKDGEERQELLLKRREIVLFEDEIERQIRADLTRKILAKKDIFERNIETISKIDLILAKAQLSLRYNLQKPKILEENSILAVNMVHPEVMENLQKQNRKFMPISLKLGQGSTVITGANMGGKSISLKTLTLNLLLMHTGFFVFAEEFSANLFDNISLLLADNQSVERGLSSFGGEVVSINELLSSSANGSFFLALDEFARGTNPKEGSKLAGALAKHLCSLDCIALMTTHYDGVSINANAHYQVAGLSMANFENIDSSISPLEKLGKMMDYSLNSAPLDADCPKDALSVCKLLELDEKLLEIFKKSY